ncbi:hypothetical protein TELCIR_10083 [Teladorsagia circumcincta]|uniref:Uncharacterized protein n=1 Tax=Teladorsagia circumcincta TaxID=45464 RepID=A0A2G9UD54_TELCI|nr:hypothetical protein TELCIR_10083 [Teladorsagia circumcincta]
MSVLTEISEGERTSRRVHSNGASQAATVEVRHSGWKELATIGHPCTLAFGKGSHSGSNLSIASNLDSEVAKASTVTDNGEVHYGDRLLDDLMNTFCDRLQAACPRKIDGCLAIQFVMVIARLC